MMNGWHAHVTKGQPACSAQGEEHVLIHQGLLLIIRRRSRTVVCFQYVHYRLFYSTRHLLSDLDNLSSPIEASQMAKEYEKRGGDYEVSLSLWLGQPFTLLLSIIGTRCFPSHDVRELQWDAPCFRRSSYRRRNSLAGAKLS